jgi:hypothetical protein
MRGASTILSIVLPILKAVYCPSVSWQFLTAAKGLALVRNFLAKAGNHITRMYLSLLARCNIIISKDLKSLWIIY